MDKALDEGYRYFSFQCCDDGEIICEVSKVGQEDWTCEDGPTPLSALTKTLKEASLNHE